MASDSAVTPSVKRASSPAGAGLLRPFGNLGWPLVTRELRADFRKSAFFLTQTACLSLLAVVLLAILSYLADDLRQSPTQIGRRLFSTFVTLQLLVVLFVFPAFSVSAFTEERSRMTLDLLLTTTLRPAEIVWGKFLASSLYSILYIVGSIPLVAISFLFGGVRMYEVLLAYALLCGLTLFVAAAGLWISSCFRSTLQATLALYALLIVTLGGAAGVRLLFWGEASDGGLMAAIPLTTSETSEVGLGTTLRSLAWLVSLFGLFILATVNRIRPPGANSSTGMRIYAALTVPLLVIVSLTTWDGTPDFPSFSGVLAVALGLLFFAAWIFPTEESILSLSNRRLLRSLRGARFPLRMLAPDPMWGVVFSVVLSAAVCAWLLFAWSGSVDPGGADPVTDALVTIPVILAAVAALGFFLAAHDFSPLYARLTVFFVLVIMTLLPVIFYLKGTGDEWWTLYYVSPVTLWLSLDPPAYQHESIVFQLGGIGTVVWARWVYGAVAVVFLGLGAWRRRSSAAGLS